MSYILDALKKSELQRGSAAATSTLNATTAQPAPANRRFALSLLLLTAALIASWFMLHMNRADRDSSVASRSDSFPLALSQQPAPSIRSAPSQLPVSTQQPASSQTAALPASPKKTLAPSRHARTAAVAVESQPSAPVQLSVPIPPSRHDGQIAGQSATVSTTALPTSHTPRPEKQSGALPVFKPITPTSAVSRIAGPLPDVPDATTRAAPAETSISAISELPLSVQQSLPSIHIEGHIYDDNPADRMVIINGAAHREKQHLSGGLTLEEITPKGAIFSYQGHVFHMGVFE